MGEGFFVNKERRELQVDNDWLTKKGIEVAERFGIDLCDM